MIAIVDYELGNIANVINAVEALDYEVTVTRDEDVLRAASHIILPGVGHFSDAMEKLTSFNLIPLLTELQAYKPFIGICLGMQLLFDASEEGHTSGLGFIEGTVKRIDTPYTVPHLGWNNLISTHPLLNQDVYFIHSYALVPNDFVVASADYGTMIPAVVQKDQLIGIQFHPEKSGAYGLTILQQALNGGFL